jgi:arylsulfatase A-like enzyme
MGLGTASLAFPRIAAGEETRPPRPNVLFLVVDDLNDWIGCLAGHPDARTPNLDRAAKRGVLFTNAHCPAPLCNPSRVSVLTGYRPSTSGIYLNNQSFRVMMPSAVTLPQHFAAAGYDVSGAGKVFHTAYPDPQSWQDYFPSLWDHMPRDPMPEGRPLSGIEDAGMFDWGPLDVGDESMGDWKVADWTARQLRTRRDRPFFLAAGLYRPHLPWYLPRKYFEMFPPDEVTLPRVKKDDLADVPPLGQKMARSGNLHRKVLATDNWANAVSAYLASIAFADRCLGRILDALDESPAGRNTILVVWGDHGWHLGEKLHWRKFTLWEEATRCPLMICVPGVTSPGGACGRSVSLLDLYPTLVELCGLPRRPALEGTSLVPLLEAPKSDAPHPPAVTTYGPGNHSVRTERWRYTRYRNGEEELYDHSSDEMEWSNLASDPDYTQVKRKLAAWLPRKVR